MKWYNTYDYMFKSHSSFIKIRRTCPEKNTTQDHLKISRAVELQITAKNDLFDTNISPLSILKDMRLYIYERIDDLCFKSMLR